MPTSAVSRSLKTARRALLIAPRLWAEFLEAGSVSGSRLLRALHIAPRLPAEFLEPGSFSGSRLLVLIGGQLLTRLPAGSFRLPRCLALIAKTSFRAGAFLEARRASLALALIFHGAGAKRRFPGAFANVFLAFMKAWPMRLAPAIIFAAPAAVACLPRAFALPDKAAFAWLLSHEFDLWRFAFLEDAAAL